MALEQKFAICEIKKNFFISIILIATIEFYFGPGTLYLGHNYYMLHLREVETEVQVKKLVEVTQGKQMTELEFDSMS